MNIFLNLLLLVDVVGSSFISYDSIYEFSKMSHNVYYNINSSYWLNTSLDVVYDKSVIKDSVRAYLFTNINNDEVVISFKGTSIYWVSNEFDTGKCENYHYFYTEQYCNKGSSSNDKFNDNLFFSCCFYKQSKLFDNCDNCTMYSNKSCCKNCYKQSLDYPLNYINVVKDIIDRIKMEYDFDNIPVYFTGHSLGGMLATIAASLYDKPAVTFETPGDLRYITLSGMRIPTNVYHFGHNGDPIYTGNCGSTCSMMGYILDTKCHTGFTCLYDSKSKLGYTESILNHRIEYIIKNVIPKWIDDLPECIIDEQCTECEDWNLSLIK